MYVSPVVVVVVVLMDGVRCDAFVAAKGMRVRCSCLVVEISLRQ